MNLRTLSLALSAFAVALLCLGVYLATASYYKAEIAALRQSAAEQIAEQTQQARAVEAEQAAIKSELDAAYVQIVKDRAAQSVETALLSSDLDRALTQLRDQSLTGSASLPGANDAARSCEDVRTANNRLADALERFVARGAAIVADGQDGIDVAAIAARWSRQIEGAKK